MNFKAVILTIIMLMGSFYTAEAQRRAHLFGGRKVVVVKPNPRVGSARVVVRSRPRAIRTLPSRARRVVYRNTTYHLANGIFYTPRNGRYVRIIPRPGFRIRTLPAAVIRLSVRGASIAYAKGVYYKEIEEGYEVIPPPEGAIIPELPEEVTAVEADGHVYYEHNSALYQKIETPEGEAFEVIGLLED